MCFVISCQFFVELFFLLAPEQGHYLRVALFHHFCCKRIPVFLRQGLDIKKQVDFSAALQEDAADAGPLISRQLEVLGQVSQFFVGIGQAQL